MDMEAQDDFMGSNDLAQIIKGKRTKRERSSSPYMVMTSSSSSGYGGGDGGGERGVLKEEYGSTSSPTASSEVCESTEEEEDMANCLILLAQGDDRPKQTHENKSGKVLEKFRARKSSDMSAPTVNKAGFFVYECKTCNRSFPSFQALGGHRASHKKPKATVEEKKGLAAASMEDLSVCQLIKRSNPDPSLSLQTGHNNNNVNKGFQGNKAAKIHECSICGSEFMSGQALGGHMRRHRANTGNQVGMIITDSSGATAESNIHGGHHQIKPRNILALDLNLPAPEDDHLLREPKFQFTSTRQALVISAPALVDCHY
ncbi:ZINC FINGER PROTEIN ZAT5 [Salix viminalis]|uniref:ZINC FINGER PROTEIN ZAT5 n=1 Tax=Salix viminalis TaxID=40686 RepID=A0A9Q0TC56_SALVM|nr:ZINC FINGER PROTEIN ZAT5 [Salix viminalis]